MHDGGSGGANVISNFYRCKRRERKSDGGEREKVMTEDSVEKIQCGETITILCSLIDLLDKTNLSHGGKGMTFPM